MMRKKLFAVLLGFGALAMLAGVATAAQPAGQAAAAVRGEAQLDLVFAVPAGSSMEEIVTALRGQKAFNVDSFFDIDVSPLASVPNIGSSGLDGVRASSFNVDSFFDITYEIFGDPDFDMVAMSVLGTLADPTNPGAVLDAVRDVLGQSRAVEFRGHVTVLK